MTNICNHCGGTYEYRGGRWVCRWCGSYKQESISTEEEVLLYEAYQKLRMTDFAQAEAAFDDIIQKYPENPGGYWGRLMAGYGIKYEQDFDGRMIPTCYAASIGSVAAAADYKKALQYADAENRAYYKTQAGYIERVRREWQEKAKKEPPYDIFICYKDSDLANGIDRTKDEYWQQKYQFAAKFPKGESVLQLAQRVYNVVDDVKKTYPGKTVLLVCHGGVSRMIKTYFEDMGNDEFFHYSPENAFVAEYEL